MLRTLQALVALACFAACASHHSVEPAPDAPASSIDSAIDSAVDAAGLTGPFANVPRDGTWTFIPFANAYCADGSSTGIGVSLTTDSDDLLIYLNGGGACWDQATCNAATTGSPLGPCATNLSTGYDETHGQPAWSTFADVSSNAGTIYDRTDPNNPLRTFNFIHIFYCTGDTHAGSTIASYTTKGRDGQPHPVHHLGYQNLLLYLDALTGSFHPSRVMLAGGRAGGFGSYTGYAAVANAFSSVPVYMIDDAGPYMENAYTPAGMAKAALAWNAAAAIPAGCTACTSSGPEGGMAALAPYLSSAYPQGRMALVTSTQDAEIRQRYELDGPSYAAALTSLATNVFDPLPNWRYFYMAGNTHTALMGAIAHDTSCGRTITSVTTPPGTVCGQTLQQFIADELGSQTWTSATPPPGVPGENMKVSDLSRCSLTN